MAGKGGGVRAACLFAGIGGFEIAAHRCGIETVWAAEWDEWKAARYRERFPCVTLYGDVEGLNGHELRRRHGPIDFLLGSPPCTDISAANHSGKGVDGDESRLYFTAVGIADALRPRWCLFENSDRLRVRGADRVCAALEAAGYACWPLVVAAGHAGAPHIRRRSWLVAADAERIGLRDEPRRSSGQERQSQTFLEDDADADGHGQLGLPLDAEVGRGAGVDGSVGSSDSTVLSANASVQQRKSCRRINWPSPFAQRWSDEPAGVTPWDGTGDGLARYVRMANGVPAWLARRWRSAYGNAVVVPVVEAIIRGILKVDASERKA